MLRLEDGIQLRHRALQVVRIFMLGSTAGVGADEGFEPMLSGIPLFPRVVVSDFGDLNPKRNTVCGPRLPSGSTSHSPLCIPVSSARIAMAPLPLNSGSVYNIFVSPNGDSMTYM